MAGFAEQQLINAKKEAAAGTPGAKEAVARLKAQQASANRPSGSTNTGRLGTAIEQDIGGGNRVTGYDPKTNTYTTANAAQEAAAAALVAQEALQQKFLQAQTQQQIAGLKGARGGSLAALGQQRERIEPAFLQQRTGLRTQEQQAGRRTEASLAVKGLARSGASTQSDIARNIALQQGLTESGQQQAGALTNIAASEADVERQFQTGVAQAEAGAASQQAQFEIEQIRQQQAAQAQTQQLEASRGFEAQRTQEARQFQLQLLERQEGIDEQRQILDREIEDARRSDDIETERELLRFKADLDQESIRLRAQLTPSKSGGAGGLTFSQDRTVFQDQVKSGIAGVESIINRSGGVDQFGNPTKPSASEQTNAIFSYLAQLERQGVDQSVIDSIASNFGVSPERIGLTEQDVLGGVTMPTFGR